MQECFSTQLKREQPLLFSMHCMAHRLGFKAVVGESSFMTTSELLFSIYIVQVLPFKCSEPGEPQVILCCSRCDVSSTQQLVVGGTRWLPHTMLALKKLWSMYPALMQHFEQVRRDSTNKHMQVCSNHFLVVHCNRGRSFQ